MAVLSIQITNFVVNSIEEISRYVRNLMAIILIVMKGAKMLLFYLRDKIFLPCVICKQGYRKIFYFSSKNETKLLCFTCFSNMFLSSCFVCKSDYYKIYERKKCFSCFFDQFMGKCVICSVKWQMISRLCFNCIYKQLNTKCISCKTNYCKFLQSKLCFTCKIFKRHYE